MLTGKRVLLGVSGGIAVYKAVEVMRRLVEQGAEVRVVMTRNAARFVAPLTFAALSGRPVLTDEFTDAAWGPMGHIAVTDGIDLALVVPATANIIGKAAAGIADDALSTALLAADCPLVMAPAMNDRMYRSKVLRRNIESLRALGVRFMDPDTGVLACGTTGQGRLASPERILQAVSGLLSPKDLTGVCVLVTGPSELSPPGTVEVVRVATAAEMERAVLDRAGDCRIIIMAAAVSDFRPKDSVDRKVKKDDAPLVILLERTTDILESLGASGGKRILVGFAAETNDLVRNATDKLKRKGLDLIVANNVSEAGAGFASETNKAVLIDRAGKVTDLPLMSKAELASRIMDAVVELKRNQGL